MPPVAQPAPDVHPAADLGRRRAHDFQADDPLSTKRWFRWNALAQLCAVDADRHHPFRALPARSASPNLPLGQVHGRGRSPSGSQGP